MCAHLYENVSGVEPVVVTPPRPHVLSGSTDVLIKEMNKRIDDGVADRGNRLG